MHNKAMGKLINTNLDLYCRRKIRKGLYACFTVEKRVGDVAAILYEASANSFYTFGDGSNCILPVPNPISLDT